jgi:hypothetical protein
MSKHSYYQRFSKAILIVSLLFFVHFGMAQFKRLDTIGEYKPFIGFKLAKTKFGDLNFKFFGNVRYLNQKGLRSTYTDSFGTTSEVYPRQDVQFNKIIITFHGWFLDPRLRYTTYAWTTNTLQGSGAQVVIAGNITFTVNKYMTFGAGINSLPGVRSTEGNFPLWLAVDNRLIADEFFRPSYTSGVFVKGAISKYLNYSAMLGDNLSQLGINAAKLNNKLDTFSSALIWHPTTGEFGINDNFGDFENHQTLATRLGLHYTFSGENAQGVPNTDTFDNVTIRLSDGNSIFKPSLFGTGIKIEEANYQMSSLDAGLKFKGLSLELEYYWRKITKIRGVGIEKLPFTTLNDNGMQLQISGMILPKKVQLYSGGSLIFGEYGDPTEIRVGLNYFPMKSQLFKINAEYIHLNNNPVGGLSSPYPVGGDGGVFHVNLQLIL